jgi:hypothetical protein
MKLTEDIRKSAKEFTQRKAEGQNCGSSRRQFGEKGAEVYAKALNGSRVWQIL